MRNRTTQLDDLKTQKYNLEKALDEQTSRRIKTESNLEESKNKYEHQIRQLSSQIDKLNHDVEST